MYFSLANWTVFQWFCQFECSCISYRASPSQSLPADVYSTGEKLKF